MKKLAVALVALLVVAVAALLVLPSFWDWNREKGRMAALVKEHTGRDLEIAGDVSLRLLPTPAFAAEQVTFANLEGGSDPAMLRLEELTISIALLPLLRGEVLIESVTLVKPEVLLEVLPDGSANWELVDAPPAAAASPASPPPRPAENTATQPIRIDSFLIEDGQVRYRDARSGVEETLGDLNAELAAGSLVGPFAADGTALFRGVPLTFDLSLGQVVEGGATPASLSLQLPGAGASVSFIGALSRHRELQTVRGRLQAEGGSLRQVLAALAAGAAPGGDLLARPFKLSAEITGSQTEATADSLQVALGPLTLNGRLTADLSGEPRIAASLAATTINLDELLAEAPSSPDAPSADTSANDTSVPPSAPRAATEGPPGTFALPVGVSGTIELAADAVVYRGQPLRQLQVAASLQDGRLDISKATVLLPGSSDLHLDGSISSAGGVPRFEGTLAAESDNLRGLLRWLGIEPEAVPAQRLRRLQLDTGVELNADTLVLRDSDLRLDVSRLTGGAAIALRKRPGLGIALNVDKINVDAYLPASTAAVAPDAAPPVAGGDGAGRSAGEPGPAQPGLGVPLLGSFDANIDLRVGEFTYQGLPFEGLRLEATLQQGGLVVRELSIADLAGSRGRFSGSVANVDRHPSIDGSLDLSVSTLSRLAKALGATEGGPLPLESFTLRGSVNGTAEELRFDQHLSALGGTLRASGRALLPPAAPRVEAAVRLDHPDLAVLLRELLRNPALPADLGAAAVEARLVATGSDLSLSGLAGEIAGVALIEGRLAVTLAEPRPKLTADISAGRLPLAAFVAAPAAGPAQGDSGGTAVAVPTQREKWSRKPLDLAAYRALDAEVRISAEALEAERFNLTDAVLEARLSDGLLELQRFTADSYGGVLSASGSADARDPAAGLQVTAEVKAEKVELRGLLDDLGDSDRFSGPVTLETRLTTRGVSEAALVSGLAGDGKAAGTVTVAAKAEEMAGAMVLDILGQKVREIRGVSDSMTTLFGAFAGAPASLDGTFLMEEGVVRSEDLTLRGRDAVARTVGTVHLPDWQLDSSTKIFRDIEPTSAYLTMTLRGPLDGPDVTVGGQPFRRQKAPAEQTPADAEPAAQSRQQEGPPAPEQLLEEGVRNLLKGLGG